MNAPKISKADTIRALRALGKVGIKALRYSVGGYSPAEIRDLAADVAEIALDLLSAADDSGEG